MTGARPETDAPARPRTAWHVAGPLAAALVALVAAPAAAAQTVQLDTAGPGTAVGLWAFRLANHLGLATTVGLLVLPAWLLDGEPRSARRATRWATAAAALWAVATIGVLVFALSNAAARPLPEALTGDLLSRFVGTRFGTTVALQVVAALAVTVLAGLARGRTGALLALGAALLAAVAPASWGHAATADVSAVAIGSDWLHIGAASLWVGGLLALTVAVAAWAVEPLRPATRFSTLASWSIGVVALTGAVNTVMHVSDPSQLLETTWGRSALAKGALLLALAGFGWVHRRRSIPRLRRAGEGSARGVFARIAGAELLVMVAAFALATSMASGLPAEAEAAARIQTFTAETEGGLVEVTLDPSSAGDNELHLYIFDPDRRLRPVEEATVTLSMDGAEVVPRLVATGPGHFTGPLVQLPGPGTWEVSIRVLVDGAVEEATGSLGVR